MERNFENLRVWQEARAFVNDVYAMMQNCRDFGFRDQIQRAAVSIMNWRQAERNVSSLRHCWGAKEIDKVNNIAEGNESGSDAKYVNFLYIAKGSCSEVRSMLYLCEDFGFCTPDKHKELHDKAQSISSGLKKLITYIENNKRPRL